MFCWVAIFVNILSLFKDVLSPNSDSVLRQLSIVELRHVAESVSDVYYWQFALRDSKVFDERWSILILSGGYGHASVEGRCDCFKRLFNQLFTLLTDLGLFGIEIC